MKAEIKHNSMVVICQIMLIFLCFSTLLLSDSVYVAYLPVFLVSCLCCIGNPIKEDISIVDVSFSILFSVMITLSNYSIWNNSGIYALINFLSVSLGSYISFINIFYWIRNHIDLVKWKNKTGKYNKTAVFFITFLSIVIIDYIIILNVNFLALLVPIVFHKLANH